MTDFKMPPEADLPYTADHTDSADLFSQEAAEETEEAAEIVKSAIRNRKSVISPPNDRLPISR